MESSSMLEVNPQSGIKLDALVDEWANCSRCQLSRPKKVHVRGCVPCETLFIGEAPGVSEENCGFPFMPHAQAGYYLEALIKEVPVRKPAIVNIVACRPIGESFFRNREPSMSEALACRPRLNQLIKHCEPKRVVLMGETAKSFYEYPKALPTLKITHPSWMARTGRPPDNNVWYQRALHELRRFENDF